MALLHVWSKVLGIVSISSESNGTCHIDILLRKLRLYPTIIFHWEHFLCVLLVTNLKSCFMDGVSDNKRHFDIFVPYSKMRSEQIFSTLVSVFSEMHALHWEYHTTVTSIPSCTLIVSSSYKMSGLEKQINKFHLSLYYRKLSHSSSPNCLLSHVVLVIYIFVDRYLGEI